MRGRLIAVARRKTILEAQPTEESAVHRARHMEHGHHHIEGRLITNPLRKAPIEYLFQRKVQSTEESVAI